jgi:hypothetical protein
MTPWISYLFWIGMKINWCWLGNCSVIPRSDICRSEALLDGSQIDNWSSVAVISMKKLGSSFHCISYLAFGNVTASVGDISGLKFIWEYRWICHYFMLLLLLSYLFLADFDNLFMAYWYCWWKVHNMNEICATRIFTVTFDISMYDMKIFNSFSSHLYLCSLINNCFRIKFANDNETDLMFVWNFITWI